MIVVDIVYEEGQRPFATLTSSTGSVMQRRQRSLSLSALEPIFWTSGEEPIPELAPLIEEKGDNEEKVELRLPSASAEYVDKQRSLDLHNIEEKAEDKASVSISVLLAL